MKTFKIFRYLAVFSIVALATASCKKPGVTYDNFSPATITVFDAYALSSVTSTNLFLNNLKITPTAVAYAGSTINLVLVAGNKTVQFKNTLTTQDVLANGQVTLAANTYNTIYLTGVPAAGDIVTTVDDLTPAPAGKAKIRTIQLSPNLANVDFIIQGGAALSTAQAYKASTTFALVDTGSYVFQLRDSQTLAIKASSAKTKLVSTMCYTFLARGLPAGSPALTAQIFNNVIPY
jgi:hypothetical protein